MQRKNTESLSEVVARVLRIEGLEAPLNEYRLINSWKEVIPPVFHQYTGDLFIRNQFLYVQITSPAAKHELFLRRKELVSMLNAKVGFQVITDIRFL